MDGVCPLVVNRVLWYKDTCRKWKHTCQCIWTSEATNSCERLTPTFSICHNVLQSWYYDRGRQSDVKGLPSPRHRSCLKNTEDLEIGTPLMIGRNGQLCSFTALATASSFSPLSVSLLIS